MQPTCRHVPPRYGSFSTTIVFNPSSPARMAATYPPGPLPIIATSYFATLNLPSAGTRCRARNPAPPSHAVAFSLGLLCGHPPMLEVAALRQFLPELERRPRGKLGILSAVLRPSKSALLSGRASEPSLIARLAGRGPGQKNTIP